MIKGEEEEEVGRNVKGSLYCRHVSHISVIHYQVLAIRHGLTASGGLQKFSGWPF